jgi:CubicO group peptidase (beta-lactamase class C family)
MCVVAELIERLSDMSFADFIRTRIALPLGLEDLWCGLPEEHHHRLADIAYVGEPMTPEDFAAAGLPVPPETEVTEAALLTFSRSDLRQSGIPGGGGTMTAAEIALFYQALLKDRAGEDGPGLWRSDTIHMGCEIRSGDLRDPVFGHPANRAPGLMIAGDATRNFRA